MSYYDTFDVEITFVDNTIEMVTGVNSLSIYDNVLNLHYKFHNAYVREATHLGSFPLANIRRWRRIDK